MNIKKMMLISILLAILTIGAVSASEDVFEDIASNDNSSDELTVDDDVDDSVLENSDSEEVLGDSQVHLTVYDVADGSNDDESVARIYAGYYDEVNMQEIHEGSLDGNVSLSIDGRKYYEKEVKSSDLRIYIKDLNLPSIIKVGGSHDVKLSYLKNGESTPNTIENSVFFKFTPTYQYIDEMSVGETGIIIMKTFSDLSGEMSLYYYDLSISDIVGLIGSVKFTNGVATLIFNNIYEEATHDLLLIADFNGVKVPYSICMKVKTNTKGYKSSISAKTIAYGSKVTVTLTGPKITGATKIFVDGKKVKSKSFYAKYKYSIANLAVGTHYITVLNKNNAGHFYYKTYKVTVQLVKLSLKKVKVKKSAKKLVLSATLKINKKVAKSKKLTFKFNGKTYKAKTNAKGIAKVTIKKSVLKKLKVGKKVKYQVSYIGKTVKKTVKVKR